MSEVLGGAAPVQPVTGIVISVPYDDYNYNQYSMSNVLSERGPARKEQRYTVTLEEAEKILDELADAIVTSRKVKDFFNL